MVCCSIFLISLLFSSASYASGTEKGESITLTREKIIELAEKNYMSVQQQNLQIKLNEAQLHYAKSQRELLGSSYGKPTINKLPTTLEELRELLPEYEQLTEEEQQEVDSMLMIQAMINASMNGMIEAQANYQYTAGMQQWSMQLEALNEEVDNSTYNVKISKLEKQKLELLAQLYALQSYYEIVGLQVDLRANQFETQLAEAAVKDAEKLYQYGLSTKREIEQAERLTAEHKQIANKLDKQLTDKLKLFKQALGIKHEDTIQLPQIDRVKLKKIDDNAPIDLKKQIDHIKAEEASSHALARLEVARANDHVLADYVHTTLVVEVEKKEIIEQWLEQQSLLIVSEQEELKLGIKELEEQQEILITKLQDYEQLFSAGSISQRELEAVSYELARLNFNLEKSQLSYFLWQEKKRIAVLGVMQ